ncbi:RNA polymerase sigma factor [Candidatus Wolfebacteria bacterium]|nr:RNA polymerase sigma factor [Candidatus Wolfebacteria bacterium]
MAPFVDRETLVDLKKGDTTAFEKVLYLYEGPILNYIYRLIKHRENARDLTQDTFVRLYEKASNIDPDGNFRGWIYKVATNIVWDWLRKETKRKEVPLISEESGEENSYLIFPESLPSYEMSHLETAEDTARTLQKLKPTYQTILTLFYYHEFKQTEIAEMLNTPLGTIKTNLRKAKIAFRETLFAEEKNLAKAKVESNKQKLEHGLSFSKN